RVLLVAVTIASAVCKAAGAWSRRRVRGPRDVATPGGNVRSARAAGPALRLPDVRRPRLEALIDDAPSTGACLREEGASCARSRSLGAVVFGASGSLRSSRVLMLGRSGSEAYGTRALLSLRTVAS